jgi:O-antigen ligase
MQVVRLRKPLLAQGLLLGGFLGALGFFQFYPTFPIQAAGEACTLLLFFWLALTTPIDSRWFLYVCFPAVGLIVFVLFYAYLFTLRIDAPILPSIWAQRYYAFFLLAPVTYALRARGWELADFRRVLVPAVLLVTMSRIVADFTVSPKSLLLSGDFFTLRLNEVYSEQAYLLRRLDLSVLFSALYFGRRVLQSRSVPAAGFSMAVATLSTVFLLISLPRVLLASVAVALIVYGAFLTRPRRARVFIVLLPLLIPLLALSVPQVASTVRGTLWSDSSFTTRVSSTQIGWDAVAQHPVFGLGQDSLASTSYQDLFGESFFPGDIGLLGIAVQYGVVGVILYLLLSAWLFANLLRLLWSYNCNAHEARSRERVFVWTLFIVCFAIALGSPVQARFIKPEGLCIAAFCLGLLVSRKGGWLAGARVASTDIRRPHRR